MTERLGASPVDRTASPRSGGWLTRRLGTSPRTLFAGVTVVIGAAALAGLFVFTQVVESGGTGSNVAVPDECLAEAPPDGSVVVRTEDEIQDVVDRHPPGTHFVLETGLHRQQSIQPRDGDRFSGQPGTVLSGAARIDPDRFIEEDDLWGLSNQARDTEEYGKMLEGHEREAHGEELWADGRRLRHVDSLSEVDRPGRWFFDYDDDRIWMFDDPASFDVVETSVTPFAFTGDARGVVIENLVVRHYANRAQRGAINGREGRDWIVRCVEASFNHGAGIGLGEGMLVHNSRFAHNGQLGIHASSGDDPMRGGLVVRDNEIAHNKQLGFRWTWEGGGTKFIKTQGMVFENNWAHHNIGPGAWWDIDNIDAVIRSNLIERNTERGLFYEISYAARIYWNVIRDHDREPAIYIASSSDVEIFENALYGSRSPIYAHQADRGESSRFGLRETVNLAVHSNDVEVPSGTAGFRLAGSVEEEADRYLWESDIRFWGNTYRSDRDRPFKWGDDMSWDEWHAIGHDVEGVLLPEGDTPSLPSQAEGFRPSHYGPGWSDPGAGENALSP
jgi:hypothetical protein